MHKKWRRWKRNRAERMRHQARQLLPDLLIRQNNKCWWCGRDLVLIPKTVPFRILYHWKKDDKQHTALGATVDHVVPLSEWGDNSSGNIVAFCSPCNNDRTASKRKFTWCFCGFRILNEKTGCRKCECRKFIEFLRNAGWDFWLDGNGGRWQNPVTKKLHDLKSAVYILLKYGSPQPGDFYALADAVCVAYGGL